MKINTRSNRRFGWLPDLPDQRDLRYSVVAPRLAALPPSVNLQADCSPVEDQGQLGSCTANALVGALEFLENKDGVAFVDLSRLFVYYNERVIIGTVGEDSGAYLRDGIKTLAKQGVCREDTWPYKINTFTKKPPKKCYTAAKKHQIISYHRIDTIEEMRTCLGDGYPFVFGFTVYESFMSAKVAKTGKVNMPKQSETIKGGHAVLAVGYNDKQKRFLVRNSWGEGWGKKGYFTMPYAYLENRNLSDDFWTVRASEEG
jgi:C1A family cysteine protease